MDISRGVLDNLMGRDRNLSKNSKNARDHYSNSDVCKPFLVCFCFNTLFPNTIYDEGPCGKRHDTYLKVMFDNDLSRGEHEKQYIKYCIHWIQKRLVDAKHKAIKNDQVIHNKVNFTGERPKQVLDRIMAIDEDIQTMMKQAQSFGEKGQIDDSSRCLQEIEKLRERRRQIESMNDTTLLASKQQKICQICGAIQTINDTEKRIQTHLQGKIHQGFLKLRNQVEALRIRLDFLQSRDGTKQLKQKQELALAKLNSHNNEKQGEKHGEKRSRSKSKGKKDKKDRQRSKDRGDRNRHRDQYRGERQKERNERDYRQKSRQRKDRKQRSSDRYGHQNRDKEDKRQRSRERHRQKSSKRDKESKKKHKKDKSREKEHQKPYRD